MLQIKYLDIEELIPYENNPRINDEAIKYVANSIEEFGFINPIVIDIDNVIVAGHTRYAAAQMLGIGQVPTLKVDELTDDQVKAFRLADNKSGEFAQWDESKLIVELEGIELDMSDFGFEPIMDEISTEEAVDDEYEVEPPEEPMTHTGQIWALGKHRLMVGDSTKADDVDKLTAGELMDLVVTDPPYNVAIENSQGMTIENDNMSKSAFLDFLTSCFENIQAALKPGGAFYVWYASREHINFETALNNAGLIVREQLIWNKNTFILGRQDYHWKHEPCLYGWKDGGSHYFVNDRTMSTVRDEEVPDFREMKKDQLVKWLERIYADTPMTIMDEKKPAKNDLHPTMKPIPLIAKQIRNSSKQGENVLDLFGGSGTTLMACEQMNRKCYMMEYDPKYADVIIDRWESFTGSKAELLED